MILFLEISWLINHIQESLYIRLYSMYSRDSSSPNDIMMLIPTFFFFLTKCCHLSLVIWASMISIGIRVHTNISDLEVIAGQALLKVQILLIVLKLRF